MLEHVECVHIVTHEKRLNSGGVQIWALCKPVKSFAPNKLFLSWNTKGPLQIVVIKLQFFRISAGALQFATMIKVDNYVH